MVLSATIYGLVSLRECVARHGREDGNMICCTMPKVADERRQKLADHARGDIDGERQQCRIEGE